MITIFEIEQAINTATVQTKRFKGTKNHFIDTVMLPLMDVFQAGLCAGIQCDPESIKRRMQYLENAINRHIY